MAPATSFPVAASTIFTTWAPVLRGATILPSAVTVSGDGPTVTLIPTQPVKLFRSVPVEALVTKVTPTATTPKFAAALLTKPCVLDTTQRNWVPSAPTVAPDTV